jgi:hypothetical protein
MTSFTRKYLNFAMNQSMALYHASDMSGKGIIFLRWHGNEYLAHWMAESASLNCETNYQ